MSLYYDISVLRVYQICLDIYEKRFNLYIFTVCHVVITISNDGFVYQMEKGTSFDGGNIEAYITTHYIHSNSTRRKKRYKNCTLEVSGSGYAEFNFSSEIGYSSSSISQPSAVSEVADFSPGVWDTGAWDTGFWDGVVIQPSVFKLSGSAENISLLIRSNSDYFSPLAFSGAQLRFLYGRQLR